MPLPEEEFVELNDMLDKLLLTKYSDVLARADLGLPKLLALQRAGEAEKQLQRCGIFKGPRDAIVAELRLRSMTGSSPPAHSKAVDAMIDTRNAQCPTGYMGDAWDVAQAALFLASDDARYITGTELVVDGGITAKFA